MKKVSREVKSRNENFSTQIETEIWQEQPDDENPYLAVTKRCYGYDIIDLVEKYSFPVVLYLLMKGELPSEDQKNLLES